MADTPDGTVDVFQIGMTRGLPDRPDVGEGERATYEDLLSELGNGWVKVLIQDGAATVVSATAEARRPA
jgi:hypothetical protein